MVTINIIAALLSAVSGAPPVYNLYGYLPPLRAPSLLVYPLSGPLYSRQYIHISEGPDRARHSGHGVHQHQHDTTASIQAILNDLVKQTNLSSFRCESKGTFPHPLDCSKYYLCDEEDQEAAEFDCLYDLTGLFFNAVTGQCDWAAKTVCFSPENNDIEAVEAEIDFDCEEAGTFPDPEYCMRYIACDEKLFASLEYCTTGTFYDTSRGQCLWASQVDCGDRQEVDLGGSEDDIIRRFPLF